MLKFDTISYMSKLSDFNLEKISFIKPKRTNKMYISRVVYENNDINIQLKRKITASGVYREGNKYYLDIIFDNDNIKDKKFIKLYKQLEMRSIKEIYKKYNEWMNVEDKLEWEDVYTSFKSHLTEDSNIKKVRFNLITNSNIMETNFFSESLEKVSYKSVEEGDEISVILNLNGIKFGKKNFENQWEILQIKVYNNTEEFSNLEYKECQINIDSDDDENFTEDSINIEELDKIERMVQKQYKKYNKEEALKIIQ